jgi:hypothetical protein
MRQGTTLAVPQKNPKMRALAAAAFQTVESWTAGAKAHLILLLFRHDSSRAPTLIAISKDFSSGPILRIFRKREQSTRLAAAHPGSSPIGLD